MNYCASSPNPQAIQSVLNNVNTGFEYELAVFYYFLTPPQKTFFSENVLSLHQLGQRVVTIVNDLDSTYLHDLQVGLTDVCLTTQDDYYKPTDVLLIYPNQKLLGLSVKYNNSCNVNISGKYFLTPTNRMELSNLQRSLSQEYIDEMTSKYGQLENWFRNRKRSEVVDYFIDTLRDSVINNWRTLSLQEQRNVIQMLFQLNSVVPYGIMKIGRPKDGQYPIEIQWNTPTEPSIIDIRLEKHETSFIKFTLNGEPLGLLQVKFNNGFFEKAKGQTYDYLINTTKIKIGSPFSSWNFTI
jgi:hypothetical protein